MNLSYQKVCVLVTQEKVKEFSERGEMNCGLKCAISGNICSLFTAHCPK
jgi:hypothetical protein